jgi:hypothetical protein
LGCSSRGSYEAVRRESRLTLGQTTAFFCGALALVALIFSVYAWFTRRSRSATGSIEATHQLATWVPVVGAVALAGIALLFFVVGSAKPTAQDSDANRAAPDVTAARGPIAAAAAILNSADPVDDAGAPSGQGSPTVADKVAAVDQHGGGSMEGAIAGLERRLAANGGSDADWELLAKSYEFLGRTSEAAGARNKQLPAGAGVALAARVSSDVQSPTPSNKAVSVSGEVILADALRNKVPPGLTLFIVAKSVNSPGPPVAILRTTTDAWPVRFQLDDSQAMLPQRNLSTAGPVTIEARTSKSGQAMPERGDFQGVTTQLDPAAGKPVRIVIERVIG